MERELQDAKNIFHTGCAVRLERFYQGGKITPARSYHKLGDPLRAIQYSALILWSETFVIVFVTAEHNFRPGII